MDQFYILIIICLKLSLNSYSNIRYYFCFIQIVKMQIQPKEEKTMTKKDKIKATFPNFDNYNQSKNKLNQQQQQQHYQVLNQMDQEQQSISDSKCSQQSQNQENYFYPIVQARLIGAHYNLECLFQISLTTNQSKTHEVQNCNHFSNLFKQLDQLKNLQKRIQQLTVYATEKQIQKNQRQIEFIAIQKQIKQNKKHQSIQIEESDVQINAKQLKKVLNLIFNKASHNNSNKIQSHNNSNKISTVNQYRTVIFVALQGLFKVLNFKKIKTKEKDERIIEKYDEVASLDIDQYLYLNSEVEDKTNRYSFGSINKLDNDYQNQQKIKHLQTNSDQSKILKILDMLLEQNNKRKKYDQNLSQGLNNQHKQKVIIEAFLDIFQESLQQIYTKIIQFQQKISKKLQKRISKLKKQQQKNENILINQKILQFVRQTRFIFQLAYNSYFQKTSQYLTDRLIFGVQTQQSCIFNEVFLMLIAFMKAEDIHLQNNYQVQSQHRSYLNLQSKLEMIQTFLKIEIKQVLALSQKSSMFQINSYEKHNQQQTSNQNIPQELFPIQIKCFVYQTLKNLILKDNFEINQGSFINKITTKISEIELILPTTEKKQNQTSIFVPYILIRMKKIKQILQSQQNTQTQEILDHFLNEFQNIINHLLLFSTKRPNKNQKQLQFSEFQLLKKIIFEELIQSSSNITNSPDNESKNANLSNLQMTNYYPYHYFLLEILFLSHQMLNQKKSINIQHSKAHSSFNRSRRQQQQQLNQFQQCVSLKQFIKYEHIFMGVLSQIHLLQTKIHTNNQNYPNRLLSIMRSKMFLHQNRTPLIQKFLFQKNIMQILAFHYKYEVPNTNKSTLDSINKFIYSQKKLEKQLKTSLNLNNSQQNSYIKQKFTIHPYKTSIWMLKYLLQKSNIKTQRIINKTQTKRGFSINQQEEVSATYEPIDPMHFLMINYNVLQKLEVQLGVLALWIITQIWMQNIDSIMKTRNSSNNSQKKLTIFGQRVWYKIINNANTNNPQKLQKVSPAQIQKYKRSLMTTLMVHLLTLKYPTKMLQYYPIQNQLLKELLQLDFFCDLIMKNQYIFQNFNQNKTKNISKNKKSQNDQTKNQILEKIKKAQNIEQLQNLCLELQKTEKQENELVKQSFQILPDEFPLPWMTLITSPKFLQNFISIPQGYFIIQKVAERRPQTFEKKYSDVYVWQISNFIGGIVSKIQNKQYRRRGNFKSLLKKQKNVQENLFLINTAEIQHQKQLLYYIKRLLQIYSKFGGQKSRIYSKQMLQKLNQIGQR